ncbi:DUF3017 domain-containing protein [Nocardia uniformis]|uniref:DUF3017 domain-containing protein n=1 Tax=Nocardia uniformis TaxID=53432 RepID=A0A849BZL8_9NOCA|nr:DUF3017 domain-containing protein [Nocardia uniformis]NNH71993.1 DUF3017 domain-containing protein [Nocardia uniformis]
MSPAHAAPESRSSRVGAFVRTNLPLILVGAVLVVAVVFLAWDRWRRGAVIIGGAALLAAAFRLLLSTEQVGLLAVRSKRFDVSWLTVLGTAIIVLAATVNTLGVG